MAIEAFANDFAKHGVQAIIDVREKDPGLYLRYIMQMIPLQVYLGEDESPGDHRKLLNAVEAKMTNQGKKLLELRTDNGSR